MSDYSSKSYRKARAHFREDCRRTRRGCSICHQPIDYNLPHTHPWAFELHHLQPSSLHPHLHYVRTNWAPSHSKCNKGQGNKPMQENWVQPSW